MKKFIFLISLLFVALFTNAQVTVDNTSMTVAQYVQNVLVGGGITTSNIQLNGGTANVSHEQVGSFNDVNFDVGLGNGMIMGSGDVTMATQLNTAGGSSLGGTGNSGNDPDLAAISTSGVFDEIVIEFDFIPTGDTITFNYVFASEEYDEYACGSVNDAFGFFLSGPNPAGGTYASQNLALIPDPLNPGTFTSTPVSINTVNLGVAGMNGTLSNCTSIDPNFATYNVFYTQNTTNTYEYDGKTTVLQAKAVVNCGVTYHIKLAIGDGGDGSFDSGVFLEAGSFSSNTVTLNSTIDIAGNDSILYEGCGTAFLDFVRTNTADTAVYNFNIVGTAGGADYNISADSVLFLPGQDTITLSFDAIQDGLTEPLETVTIQLIQTVCNVADTQVITFYISDYPQLTITTNDTLKNCGSTDSLPIWVNVVGPPYTVLWNTGETSDTIWINPSTTTTYYVTVEDTCGVYSIQDSATVTITPTSPIVLTMANDTSKYCPQDSMYFYVSASGGDPGYTYNWSPGGLTDSLIHVSPLTTTTYFVNVTDACGATVQDSILFTVPTYVPLSNTITTNDTTICSGLAVPLNANITGGLGSYYSWNNGLGSVLPIVVNPIVATDYILTAQDSCGATVEDTISVTISLSNYQINLPTNATLICLSDVLTLDPNIAGGNGSETYLWSTGETTATIQVSPTVTTTYGVVVTDGCSASSDTIEVIVPIFNPIVLTVNNDLTIDCPGTPIVLLANFTGGSQNVLTFNWSDGINNFTGNNLTVNPVATTTYTVWVNDTCALDSGTIASFTVTVPKLVSLQLNVTNDTLICLGDYANLVATPSGGEGNYSYSWNSGALSNFIQVSPDYNKNYTVTVTDGCGGQLSKSVLVSVVKATAHFGYEYTDEFIVQFTDSSYSNIVSHWWTFDFDGTYSDVNPVYTFDDDGAHDVFLLVQDIYGCYDSTMQTITPPLFIYGPNSFTPDGDDLNDTFKFKGVGIKHFELLIFDRWGELLFKTNDIETGWNGIFKGKLLPVGVYVYKVNAESYDNAFIEKTGNVNLLK